MDNRKQIKQEFWYTVRTVVIVLIVYYILKSFIIQPFVVKGSSMEQNFHDGDYIIVDQLSYNLRQPKRNEVVVFKSDFISHNSNEYYIKRIVGLPGERVVIDNNKVIIYNNQSPQGFVLDQGYLQNSTQTFGGIYKEVSLNNDEYYVLGDNREHSSDSRFWGVLKKRYILGKPVVRLFPFNKAVLFNEQAFSKNLGT